MKHPKANSRSVIAALPQSQRDAIAEWLFDQNLSPAEVARKIGSEFQAEVDHSTVQRFYQTLARKRNMRTIALSAQSADGVVKQFTDNPSDTYQELLRIGGQIAFNRALKSEEDPKNVDVVRDFIRVLTAARREDIYARKFFLDREKWEFDVARTCHDHLTELQAISADGALDEHARLLKIRRRLFGANLPE